jgi:hypothetical protein
VFDTAQFLRRGWMHRNRISDGAGGWNWIRASLRKAPRDTPVGDIQLRDDVDWRRAVLGGLTVYASFSDRYTSTRNLVRRCLDIDTRSLARLNVHALAVLSEALAVDFDPVLLSGSGVDPGPSGDPQGRVLTIAKALGASEVVNLPGGRGLYDPEAFERRGIRLAFVDPPVPAEGASTPGEMTLSIVDDLMRDSPEALGRRLSGEPGGASGGP